jgi:hypothetical protein
MIKFTIISDFTPKFNISYIVLECINKGNKGKYKDPKLPIQLLSLCSV